MVEEETGPRVVDATALHGLAHPLRLRLWDELSVHGAATASELARRVGESSGATSYHLRQLERHGFIEEDEERGSGRERWWRVPARGTVMHGFDLLASPATRQAADLVLGEVMRARDARYRTWHTVYEQWPREWVDASVDQTAHLKLRADELAALRDELGDVVTAWVDRVRGRRDEDLVDVEIQVNAFPVGLPVDYPRAFPDTTAADGPGPS